ncbi:catalase family protein [Parahaliea mediterranea]|uniref:Catalase family protein n=1 Tax=Parahaliea mediterranea TaxID=651086 RepID=A0A939IL03_9GAMM|nr:catalase family protein [Parahaliea mediterranea]MBN7795975.1 catalase family protein [Parahaliea mediterranea]
MRRVCALPLLLCLLLLAGCDRREPLAPGQERPDTREAAITGQMVEAIEAISLARDPGGTLHRFNQVKGLACLEATFSVPPDLPPQRARGLFARPGDYPATLRLARASEWDDRDKDFHGLSLKVRGVAGDPLWGRPGEQDFLLNSHPALFAANPGDFLDFIRATRDGAIWRYLANPSHWYSLPILLRGRQVIDNPLAITYWSTTPYRFGDEGTAVKYSVRPCDGVQFAAGARDQADFLADAVAQTLADGPACLRFMVQFQGDPRAMPVENASVTWPEEASPFLPVAELRIPPQDFRAPARRSACEAMAFNPWQSLPEHRPLGGINRVRKAVYAELARFRAATNARRGKGEN